MRVTQSVSRVAADPASMNCRTRRMPQDVLMTP
jgi:hypothetical protein